MPHGAMAPCRVFLLRTGIPVIIVAKSMKKINRKNLTGMLSQTEIVTLAVYSLGGDQRAVDTEDAAVMAHKLAPGRFCWRKYPDQINLELVRVYLSDAKKIDKGGLLTGSGRTGWALTPKGLEWARKVEPRVAGIHLGRGRSDSRAGSIDENRWRRERGRLLRTPAWASWSEGNRELSADAASEVFRLDSYAVGQLRETKVTRLLSLFQDDSEILPFLKEAARLTKRAGD